MPVELSSALAQIPSLDDCRFLVALIHVLDQLRVYLLDVLFPRGQGLDPKVGKKRGYLLEFMRAEKGLADMFSSIGRLTEGIGMFEMPLSYNLRFNSFFLARSGTKLLRSI